MVLIEPLPPLPSPTGGDGSPVEPMKPASMRPTPDVRVESRPTSTARSRLRQNLD
jgi:hypothetical protein